jgi:hypothetical protein
MIAGNLVEIRVPKTQSRKCLRKSNLWRYRAENVFGSLISTKLYRHDYHPTTCLNPRNFFLPRCLKCTLPFKPISYHIFDLLLVVVFFHYVIVVSITSRFVNLKKNLVNDSIHFYVWTASLICLSIIERNTVSIKRKTDIELSRGCVLR